MKGCHAVILVLALWGFDMKSIEGLKQALRAINETAFQGLYFDHRPIQQEIKKLESLVNKPDTNPPIDRIQVAMGRFLNTSNLESFQDLRLISYGAATPLGYNQIRLIEKKDHFLKLLDMINSYRDRPRAFRRLYRGLLSSYFSYDPQAPYAKDAGPDHWQHLRRYLNEHMNSLQTEGVNPDWIAVLQEHKNLLTADPCSRYAEALLDGASDTFGEAGLQLGFSGASWVTRAVVAARIEAAIRRPDPVFKAHLVSLLKLLGDPRHATLLNTGLAQLLERYAKTQPLMLHHELRNFAVEHWKNPWLPINQNRWALVSESTRKMVGSWLKLDLMKSFFELLSADGSNDTRRLDFWIRYIDEINDMYFALGRHATQSQDISFVAIRKKMAGRLLRLSGTGRENNAFIMTIGNIVFVEFGMQGNAAYIYPLKEIPFDLDGVHDINLKALKDTVAGDRLYHKDNVHGYTRWERRFNAYLYQNFGIKVSNEKELPEPWASGSYYTTCNTSTIKTFCQAFKLVTDDASHSGGYFWILADDQTSIINQQLRTWGFSYRPGRGWFLNG